MIVVKNGTPIACALLFFTKKKFENGTDNRFMRVGKKTNKNSPTLKMHCAGEQNCTLKVNSTELGYGDVV